RETVALPIKVLFGGIESAGRQDANPCDLPGLFGANAGRPRCDRPADHRDELAPSHSITSSARPSSVIGKVSPSDFALLRLMRNSVLVDCWTGRAGGLSP